MEKKQNTGAVIRQVALELFARRGFAGTSMRDIAKEVEITPANLYNYTSSKQQLLWEVMEHIMTSLLEELEQTMASQSCPAGCLATFVERHTAWHARNRLEASVGNSHIQLLDPEHEAETKAFRDRYERGLRAILEAGEQGGLFHLDDTRFASFAILAMGIGVSRWYQPGGERSVEQLSETYADFALRMAGFDEQAHATACSDVERCVRLSA